MPNYVYNKISFNCDNPQDVVDAITTNGSVDFNTLIPRPLYIYQGDINRKDENDFGDFTWYEWSRKNWGTKWNAGNSKIEIEKHHADVYFETARTVPYPFIIAFANCFRLDFTLQYVCETKEHWGIEEWKCAIQVGNTTPTPYRVSKNIDDESMYVQIYTSVNGFAPNSE